MVPSVSLRLFRIEYNSSEAVSFTSPYLSTMDSILLRTFGKPIIGALILLRFGYTPSLTSSKKAVTLCRVSSIVLSFRRDIRSIAAELFSNGTRKSMQSMNPPQGKLSSNIIISLISSVSSSLFLILAASVQNSSVATLSDAYAVEHLSEMMLLILSNPNFCSTLESIITQSMTFKR